MTMTKERLKGDRVLMAGVIEETGFKWAGDEGKIVLVKWDDGLTNYIAVSDLHDEDAARELETVKAERDASRDTTVIACQQCDEARAERDALLKRNAELQAANDECVCDVCVEHEDRRVELAKVTAERDAQTERIAGYERDLDSTFGPLWHTWARDLIISNGQQPDYMIGAKKQIAAMMSEARAKLAAYDARDADARLVCEYFAGHRENGAEVHKAAHRYLYGAPSPTATQLEEATRLLREVNDEGRTWDVDSAQDHRQRVDAFLGRAS